MTQSKEARAAYMREWIKRDTPASVRARAKRSQWSENHPHRRKQIAKLSMLKAQIGRRPSDDEISALFRASDGLCAICLEEPATRIDHSHATLELRGVLCHNCNVGLGHFKDDPEKLLAAAEYLKG